MRRRWRRVLLFAFEIPLSVLAVWFAVRTLLERLSGLDLSGLSPALPPLVGAVLSLLAAKMLAALAYCITIRGLGGRIPVQTILAARIAVLPARYVPGRVAATGGLALLLSRFGLSGTVALSASVIPLVVSLLAGILVSVPVLLLEGLGRQLGVIIPAAVPVALLLACMLHPALLPRLLDRLLRRMGKPGVSMPPARVMLGLMGVTVARFVLVGTVLYLLALAFGPVPLSLLPLVSAAAVISFVAGFLVFFVPAGIGVRESVILLVLSDSVPLVALAVLLFRALDVVTDLGLGLSGAVITGRRLKAGGRAPSAEGADRV